MHLNWVTTRDRFSFEHCFHTDSWKHKLVEEEINTTRVVTVVTLKYSKEGWDTFRTEVQLLHDVTPQTPGCETSNFVTLTGKVMYRWVLFISSDAQIVIVKVKSKEYRKLLVELGILPEFH